MSGKILQLSCCAKNNVIQAMRSSDVDLELSKKENYD